MSGADVLVTDDGPKGPGLIALTDPPTNDYRSSPAATPSWRATYIAKPPVEGR